MEESPFGLTKAAQLLDAFEEAWNFHSVQRLYLPAMLAKAKKVGAADVFASRSPDKLRLLDVLPPVRTEQDVQAVFRRESQLGMRQNEHA